MFQSGDGVRFRGQSCRGGSEVARQLMTDFVAEVI
jgi:hypothetical protein